MQDGVQQYYSQPLRFSTEDALTISLNLTGLQPDTKYKVQVSSGGWFNLPAPADVLCPVPHSTLSTACGLSLAPPVLCPILRCRSDSVRPQYDRPPTCVDDLNPNLLSLDNQCCGAEIIYFRLRL